ncbi:HAMP domain-containing sensor histidine kinase [Crossiella sp. CA-258035]|uniref:sensor histidine kinase n=1 Tax=Crossiella sp. CA-258035 TaxID=2981138 RepID=UPI0024BC2D49|nr:HAMP domain-containing sensor histidine kinase [Crossiella sp. CA-258035]WHT18024.1 HAMP domain-containing sensor histidine kinase [Crossiella sp. CA-258035]
MSTTSADRLRRLRRLLTLLFTALNAAGLILFAYLVIREDRQQGEQHMDADLRRVSAVVSRLIDYDGTINTEELGHDQINNACPQFTVLDRDENGEWSTNHTSEKPCAPLPMTTLTSLAQQSVDTRSMITGYQRGSGGELLRVTADSLRNRSGQYVGAVVAALDARETESRHDRRVLIVLGVSVLLVGACALAGHVLSGRAMRPAVDALAQQEALLGDIAHDLRKPVAALRALAETGLRNPDQHAELLPRAVRLSARMGGIIDGLLMRARFAAGVQELARQPIWLDQLVAGVVEDTPPEGARITLTTSPSKVDADPVLVQRAVANLLGNALQHGHQPGAAAVVHVSVAGNRVTVADQGPGIDAERAELALDRFTSGGGSSGLGLAIVRWVAQAHGGTLRVYNAEAGGAIFELELPAVYRD